VIKQQLKEEVAAGCKIFWGKRLSPGRDAGDLSLRDPETGLIYICPMATEEFRIDHWGVVTADDIVVIDIDGKKVDQSPIHATIEAPMHLYIYRGRQECNAIVHSHGEWTCAFAAVGRNIPAVLSESAFIGGEIICAEYGKVGSLLLAENIAKALGKNKKAALMKNHGAVALGRDLREAFAVSDFLEKQAMTVIRASSLGKLIQLDMSAIKDESNL
jgi:L-ribulose-5-phosphate 4-epimerase